LGLWLGGAAVVVFSLSEFEARFAEFVIHLPALVGDLLAAHGVKAGEGTRAGEFGEGAELLHVAQEMEAVEVPIEEVSKLAMEVRFLEEDRAVAAPKDPLGECGIFNESLVTDGGGLVFGDQAAEQRLEIGGVLARDEEIPLRVAEEFEFGLIELHKEPFDQQSGLWARGNSPILWVSG